jgi:hypothetical protein
MRACIILLVTFVCKAHLFASPEMRQSYFDQTKSLYAQMESSDAGGAEELLTTLGRIDALWNNLAPEDKAFLADRRWHDYRDAATRFASAGDYLASAIAIRKHANFCAEFGMSPEGRGDSDFLDFAKLQAGIVSQTGSDPLAGMVNYLFQKNGDEYMVARQELDPEVNGVTIDGVSESESLVQAHYFNSRDGKVTLESTRWFIGPKGNIADTLNHATREVLQDQYGRFEPKPIKIPILSGSVQAKEIEPPPQSTPIPPVDTPRQQPKSSASPSSALESKPSPSFPIVPVAIVGIVIAGIVVFLLRRKSA